MPRSKSKILIIFIDSLPFYKAQELGFLKDFKSSKLTPSIGFSINIIGEIFTGKNADDIGFFNEWTFNPKKAMFRNHDTLSKLLSLFEYNYVANRVIHKIINRVKGNVLNIPFKFLRYLSVKGKLAYDPNFNDETLLSKHNFLSVTYKPFKFSRKRDLQIYNAAKKGIWNSNKLFVTFVDLDHVGHKFGVNSKEYANKIRELERYILHLSSEFGKKGGQTLVFSDHGMVDVSKAINLRLEKNVGEPGINSYLYFIDATMARFWVFNKKYERRIIDYLSTVKEGKILSSVQREEHGITSNSFGDVIFILDEKVVFETSFFGKGKPAAMHGYLPVYDSQKATLFYNGEEAVENLKSSKDLYGFLKDLLSKK